MIGTVVNTLAILIGGGLGSMICGKFPPKIRRLILQCLGMVALFLGARSLLSAYFVDSSTAIEATGTMLVVFSLLVGWVFGEALRLDRLVDSLGRLLSRFDLDTEQAQKETPKAAGSRNTAGKRNAIRQARRASAHAAGKGKPPLAASTDNERVRWWQLSKLPTYPTVETRTGSRFIDGFAWATLLCALNAMGFSGAINAGMTGEPKELFIKAAVDAVLVLALSSIYGIGAAFGAIPVLAVEGILVFASNKWSDLMTPTLISHLTVIAAIMTLGAGLCLCFDKKWRVVNLVPALLISPLYGLIVNYAEKLIDK